MTSLGRDTWRASPRALRAPNRQRSGASAGVAAGNMTHHHGSEQACVNTRMGVAMTGGADGLTCSEGMGAERARISRVRGFGTRSELSVMLPGLRRHHPSNASTADVTPSALRSQGRKATGWAGTRIGSRRRRASERECGRGRGRGLVHGRARCWRVRCLHASDLLCQ